MNTACNIMKDYGTEFNMSTVMQYVRELKAWQESEQQKLCENPTMNTLRNEMEEVMKTFNIPTDVQENYCDDRLSSYSEIDEELLKNVGYQNDRIPSPVSNFKDDLQILSPNKNFDKSCKMDSISCNRNEIENNQLENENNLKCNNIIPKKPYLKRGAGLARYGLKLNEIKKKAGKLKFHKPLKSIPSKAKVTKNCLNQVVRFPKPEFVTKPIIESTRLDLEKVKVADSWNRYDIKNISDGEENYSKDQSELRAFEMLEERANKSDFNASSPTVGELLKKGQHSKCNKKVPASGLVRSLNFERINTSTPHENSNESDDSYSDFSQECDPINLSEDLVQYTNIKNNSRQNNHKKTDQVIILTENEKEYLENYTKSSGIIKNINYDQSFDTEILTKRLEELESEIEKFRIENTKLMKLQQEFEIERQKFFKCKEDFIKKLDEEKKREEEILAEERKKLMKEKCLFDKNVKEFRNKPNRIEREEIKQLKKQLAELKEEFNKKEARWATGQARLRTQMKLLENNNLTLRNELELFRKTSINKKVTFKSPTERQAIKSTKIIHNINTELSKLTPDNVLSIIDPKTKIIPASILRNGVGTSTDDYESSEEIYSDQNYMNSDDNEDDVTETNNTECNSSDVIREINLDDGRKEILYSNGNLKKISADGLIIKVIYYNGDVKETREDYERYYFAKNKTYHSTYNSGLEIIEFPNGQIEKHYKDGKVEIEYVDGKKHTVYPDRKEVWNYLDGSVLTVNPNGQRELVLLNGQQEIHTNEYKKRVYPDGTLKFLYPDGSQETKYPDGRIRKKDKDGNLTMDNSVSS